MRNTLLFFLLTVHFACNSVQQPNNRQVEVLVIGGGTGGTAAAISAARMGVKTLIVEEGPWLGGMISSAGVTCTDGNHHLPSGLWNEFREKIYHHYGGPQAVATGWVSMTQFEPHVSDSIWKAMAKAEKNLEVLYGWQFEKVIMENERVAGAVFKNKLGETLTISAVVCIDATELGDVLANAGIPFSLGMESGEETGENVGVTQTNDIVQDLTWVAVLKDYGPAADCTIAKPTGYDPMEFDGVCTDYYNKKELRAPNVDGKKMLDYGRLPNGKYMINWPNAGNDTYLNVVNLSPEQRVKELEKAKATTLRFVYFIQQQLGFKHLGLADDEFPTEDRLALMPYHREGRRVQGLVRMNIKQIAEPFSYGDPLYRTGISVGDYPIDHHHKKNPQAPQHLDFYAVPSYNIPLGALIPQKGSGLIIAEKAISVTNVVNGTTRLQPVVILTGQAAGTLAGLSVKMAIAPKEVPVREVQKALLNQKAYLMPYYDVKPWDPQFDNIQRIGASGLLKGKGEPYQWANRTWFYPDTTINAADFLNELSAVYNLKLPDWKGPLTIGQGISVCKEVALKNKKTPWGKLTGDPKLYELEAREYWKIFQLNNFDTNRPITKRELSVMIDKSLNPFELLPVNHRGQFLKQTTDD